MEQANVIGRLAFLANVVGDGAVRGIQQMARGTGAAMTKLASAVPAAAFASSAIALAGVGAALAGGVKAAAEFEESFALVRKVLARASEEELGAIRDSILELSTEIPVAAGQLATLGSIAGQLGVEVQNIPQFIDTVAKLGVATNMTAEQAAFSVARLANVTGIGAENADQLANVLVRLGNNTAATESEITLLATRFGAVGKIAGLTADQTLAFSASVRATGTEAQAGATALQKFFLALQQAASQGGTKLKAFADAVGMSGDEFRKLAQEDISNAAALFVEGLDRIGSSGGDVQRVLNDVGLGSVRVSKVMLSLSSDTEELRSNLALAADEMERQTALNNEAEKRFGTLIQQIQRFKNAIRVIMIDIGEDLVPVIADFVGNVTDAIVGIKELTGVLDTDSFVRAAKALTVLTVAIGSLRLAAVKGLVDTIALSFMFMAEGAFVAAGGVKALFLAFKPFLIGAAIVAGIAGILKIFGNMAEEIAIAKRNLEDFEEVMNNIDVSDSDFDISDTLAEGLFENLEEDTQNAFKQAFGRDTTNVLKEILGNQSTEVLGNITRLSEGMAAMITSTSSYLATDEAAESAIRSRLEMTREETKLIGERLGTESKAFQIASEIEAVLEKRVEQGGKLTLADQQALFALTGQLDAYDDLLALQNKTLEQKMEIVKEEVKHQLTQMQFSGDLGKILNNEKELLRIARQMAPENKIIADAIGFIADKTEEAAKSMSVFDKVLQRATDFATELNNQLAPLEALQDLEDAQDNLKDAKKDVVDLGKEEVEVQTELANIERELNDLLQDGKFLNDDIISIKEEELQLAEMIKAVNEGIELSYQEQLKLLKLERQLEILKRAAAQGTLDNSEIQIGAIQEQIDLIKSGGVTEQDIIDQTAKVQETKDEAKINAQERINELLDLQQEKSDRLIEIDDEIEDAKRAVERAQVDVLKKTNESVIAFAKLGNEGSDNMLKLGRALGFPEERLKKIVGYIDEAKLKLGTLPAFTTSSGEGMSAEDAAALQGQAGNVAVPRAMGGMVRLGQTGLVGEAGMEIIKPMPHGVMVTPLQGGGGGQPINQYVSLNVTGLPTDPLAARKIAQNIQRELNKLKTDGRSGIVR